MTLPRFALLVAIGVLNCARLVASAYLRVVSAIRDPFASLDRVIEAIAAPFIALVRRPVMRPTLPADTRRPGVLITRRNGPWAWRAPLAA